MKDLFVDTICAPASAAGGAVAMVRVSGPYALDIAGRIFVPAGKNGSPLACAKGYTMHFGEIRGADGRLIDEVVASVFRAPASYTGENSVEISCHGSSYIVQEILALLLENGARMAAPGEFTQRAFVNGKMDLSQAEAVADLIASQTEAAHKVALNQLKGGFSNDLASMREQLLQIVSLMELELDFSEEDVEFADRSQLRELLDKVISHIDRLISGFKLGNAIKNGVPVAIVGATNAGKSTLLNAIIGENRAIVSDIAGTTRDTIEETYNIDGVLFRFIDTAGLRHGIGFAGNSGGAFGSGSGIGVNGGTDTIDAIEKIGIERAYEKLAEASLVLAVADLTSPLGEISSSASDILAKVSDSQNIIFLLNKADVAPSDRIREVGKMLASLGFSGKTYPVSAREKIGMQDFLKHISDTYKTLNATTETTLVTNVRHLEALKSARTALDRVRQGLGSSVSVPVAPVPTVPVSAAPVPTDLLAQDLREALYHLGSITGEITTDEILGNIFSRFCIGK